MTDHAQKPQLPPASDAADAYRLVRQRVDALVRGRDVTATRVPACPVWTVHQTVAHLVGVAQDVSAANLEGVASAAWTQAQVDRFSENSGDQLLDLWRDPPLAAIPDLPACQLVFDALTHEHDIRGALGEAGPRTGDLSYRVALGFLATMYDAAFRGSGAIAMLLSTPSLGTVQLGDPGTAATALTLEISDFEALRAFGGRRSERQLRALPWHPEAPDEPPAARNQAIRPPDDDLVE